LPGALLCAKPADHEVRRTIQFDCAIKRFPAKTRLRLVIESHRLLQGLDSFPLRAQLRLSGRDKRTSLNPFYKGLWDTGPVEVVTEEFLVP